MEKKDDQKPINKQGEDPRVSGPLDRRLISVDHQNFGVRPEGVSSDWVGEADKIQFIELIEQFAAQINLPDMQVDSENCCSISIGEGQEAVVVTLELRSDGEILIFTPLERHPEGISPELANRIEIISAAQQDGCHFLTTSERSVFFCASHSIEEATINLFADWILDFYKRALVWRERYRRDTATGADSGGSDPKAKRSDDPKVSASLRISPSTGLKV
jgi:hypothetical protein